MIEKCEGPRLAHPCGCVTFSGYMQYCVQWSVVTKRVHRQSKYCCLCVHAAVSLLLQLSWHCRCWWLVHDWGRQADCCAVCTEWGVLGGGLYMGAQHKLSAAKLGQRVTVKSQRCVVLQRPESVPLYMNSQQAGSSQHLLCCTAVPGPGCAEAQPGPGMGIGVATPPWGRPHATAGASSGAATPSGCFTCAAASGDM